MPERYCSENFTIVCVDEARNDGFSGRYYFNDINQERIFTSIHHLFTCMDNLLHSNQPLHNFEECNHVCYLGTIATFRIQIRYLDKESWQGHILWLETRHEESFHSCLQLLRIMYQLLELAKKKNMRPSTLKYRKWK